MVFRRCRECVIEGLGVLDGGAVGGYGVWMWLILWCRRVRVAETCEGFIDISRHGEVDLVICVVPIQGQTKVARAFPICITFVVLFEDGDQVLSISLVDVFDTKIVNDKGEADGPPACFQNPGVTLLCMYPALWSRVVSNSCAMMPA